MIAAGAAIAGQEDRQSQMRTTLLATARRRYSFGAKAALTVAISVVGCLLSGAFALALGSALFGIPLSPRDWLDSLAKFSLAAISWTLLGLLGLGVSTIAQSMLASIAILGALVVGGSSLLLAITPFARYLPDMATMRLFTNDTSLLQPAVGVAIQLVWAAVGLAIACSLYDRRDVR